MLGLTQRISFCWQPSQHRPKCMQAIEPFQRKVESMRPCSSWPMARRSHAFSSYPCLPFSSPYRRRRLATKASQDKALSDVVGDNNPDNTELQPTYEELMTLSRSDLQKQCLAVGLSKSRTKEELAKSLLETMNFDASASDESPSDEEDVEERPHFADAADEEAYDLLMALPREELRRRCGAAGLSRRGSKAVLANNLHNTVGTATEAQILEAMNFPAKNSRQNAAPVERGPAVPDLTNQTSSWEPADRVSSVEQLQAYSENELEARARELGMVSDSYSKDDLVSLIRARELEAAVTAAEVASSVSAMRDEEAQKEDTSLTEAGEDDGLLVTRILEAAEFDDGTLDMNTTRFKLAALTKDELDEWLQVAKRSGRIKSWSQSGKTKYQMVEKVIEMARLGGAQAGNGPGEVLHDLANVYVQGQGHGRNTAAERMQREDEEARRAGYGPQPRDRYDYDALMNMGKRELAVKCGELGLPKSHRTKAQMVSNLIAYSEGEDLSQLQPLLGKEMMEGPRQARVAPYDLTGRPEVFEQPMNNAQTKSSGPRTIINPNRRPATQEEADFRDMEEEGPIVQGGHDVPGLSSMSGRDRRGYNPIDRDEDVVAQQRRGDKRPAFVSSPDSDDDADAEFETMDGLLTETQEPEPGYDLDDEQRPRLSRNADGDITEANFGNNDDTDEMLEDQGIPGNELIQDDLARQYSGAAKRRRQRSRQSIGGEDLSDIGPVPASSLKDDLDDDIGFDEGFDADSQSDVRLPAAPGDIDASDRFDSEERSGDVLENGDLEDGFEIPEGPEAATVLEGEDEDERFIDDDSYDEEDDDDPRRYLGQAEFLREEGMKEFQRVKRPDDRINTGRVKIGSDKRPTDRKTSQIPSANGAASNSPRPSANSSGMAGSISHQQPAVSADPDGGFGSMPDWLASKYKTADPRKLTNPQASMRASPQVPSTPASAKPTKMKAISFKPKKRQPRTEESYEADLRQSGGTSEAMPSSLDAALRADARLTNEAVSDSPAALSSQATAAMDTMLSSEASPSSDPGTSRRDPYSQSQAGRSGNAGGAISPSQVNDEPSLTPEADQPPADDSLPAESDRRRGRHLEAGDVSPDEVDRDSGLDSGTEGLIDAIVGKTAGGRGAGRQNSQDAAPSPIRDSQPDPIRGLSAADVKLLDEILAGQRKRHRS